MFFGDVLKVECEAEEFQIHRICPAKNISLYDTPCEISESCAKGFLIQHHVPFKGLRFLLF